MGRLSRRPSRTRALPLSSGAVQGLLVTALVGGITFLLAYDGGSYAETSRDSLAIIIWWTIVLAVGLGFWSLTRFTRTSLIAGALLSAFVALNLASTAWATSAEDAYSEFNRAALYLGIFVLAALAATRGALARWSDGLACGISATGLLALVSRLFPDLLHPASILQSLPLDLTRLSYPLGYWNGLAMFVGLAVPFLLRAAVASSSPVARGLAVAPIPVLTMVIYLASSRGGAATAAVGAAAYFALTPYRMRTVVAMAAAAAGSVAALAAVLSRPDLVNHPGTAVAGQGHVAAVLILLACLGSAVLYVGALRFLAPRLEGLSRRVSPTARRAMLVASVLLVLGGIAAADPVQRFETFKKPPPFALDQPLPTTSSDPIQSHLLSAGSSGRWQEWGAALAEFRSSPTIGRGAGSFEAWWAQHGTLHGFIKDAHSLYLETLGELGLAGFPLIVGAFLVGLVAGAGRVLRNPPEQRATVAALWAAFLAYVFAAGIDWMWEMTVVSVVGVAVLGLLTSRASSPDAEPSRRLARRRDLPARGALVLTGIALIAAQTVSLVTNRKLQTSQAAIARGDVQAALQSAEEARRIEPWASSPLLQLALVAEQANRLAEAQTWIEQALVRDRTDWRLWFVLTRIQTGRGDISAARKSLRRAIELNPRSSLFASHPEL